MRGLCHRRPIKAPDRGGQAYLSVNLMQPTLVEMQLRGMRSVHTVVVTSSGGPVTTQVPDQTQQQQRWDDLDLALV